MYEEEFSHETNYTLSPPSDDPNKDPIQLKQIYGDRAFLLYNLLSEQECTYYINESERLGLDQLTYDKRYRNNTRCTVLSPEISEAIWNRVKEYVAPIILEPNDYKQIGKGYKLEGTWIPSGLNPCWRICKYFPGGHFGPHFDGPYIRNSDERSLQTLNIYLNGDFEGGTTNFLSETQSLHSNVEGRFCAEEKNIVFRVVPTSGMALIFNHMMLHEGEELKSNVKYIMRSDIMYHRQNPPAFHQKEQQALNLIIEAQNKETNGEFQEAASLYRRALHLWPAFENSL